MKKKSIILAILAHFVLILEGFASPITAITPGHPDPFISSIHDDLTRSNPAFLALGAAYLIVDPNLASGVAPFVLSAAAPERKKYEAAGQVCADTGARLPTLGQIQSIGRSMRPGRGPRRYDDPELIAGMAGTSIWSSELHSDDWAATFDGTYRTIVHKNREYGQSSVRCVLELNSEIVAQIYVKAGDEHRLQRRYTKAAESYTLAAQAIPGTLAAVLSHRKAAEIYLQLRDYPGVMICDSTATESYRVVFETTAASAARITTVVELRSLLEEIKRTQAQAISDLETGVGAQDEALVAIQTEGHRPGDEAALRGRLERMFHDIVLVQGHALACEDVVAARIAEMPAE